MLRSFRTLKWKLTVSYTLVTVAALVVVQVLLLVAGLIILRVVAEEVPGTVTREMANELAPRVSPYLAGETPDLAGIDRWLRNVGRVSITAGGDDEPGISLDIAELVGRDTRLLVLDARGRLLGSTGQAAPPGVPEPLDLATVPGLADVLPHALAGEEGARLHEVTDARDLTIAVPIRGSDGAIVGSLALNGPYAPEQAIIAGSTALIVLTVLGLVFFTVTAGLVGTLFGFFTARGLTRRLNRVTATATAWGAGDFSHLIRDRSADEIGELGRQLNRMAIQLEDELQTRQELSAVDERNRLARELHDSVKQQVFAITMNLGAARSLWEQDPDAARGRLDAAFELARQSQQELTNIIQALRPPQLDGKGLRQALTEYVARWQEQSGIAASFLTRGDRVLPLLVEEALFRIAQEALANVARHSRASQALITVTADGHEATLLIEDNGHGFDARRPSPGIGLRSMRERVEAVGGTLQIDSGPRGTSALARIPIAGLP